MVRAANLAPDLNEQQQGDVQPESLTQLRVQSQATTSMAATDESRRRYAGVLAVANAFLNNVAGGGLLLKNAGVIVPEQVGALDVGAVMSQSVAEAISNYVPRVRG